MDLAKFLGANELELSSLQRRFSQNPPSLRELHNILMAGSVEERLACASACGRPEFYAANQDFVLAALHKAMSGSSEEQRFYESHRVLVEASMPRWFLPHWKIVKAEHSSALSKKLGKPVDEPEDELLVGCSTYSFTNEIVERRLPRISRIRGGDMVSFVRSMMCEANNEMMSATLIEDLSVLHNFPWSDSLKLWLWEGIRRLPWSIGRTQVFLDAQEVLGSPHPGRSDEEFHDRCARIFESKESYLEWAAARMAEQKALRAAQRAQWKKTDFVPSPSAEAQQPDSHQQTEQIKQLRYSIAAAIRINFPGIVSTRDYARSIAKLIGFSFHGFQQAARKLNSGSHPEQLILELRAERRKALNTNGRLVRRDAKVADDAPETSKAESQVRTAPVVKYSDDAMEVINRDGRWRMAVTHELEKLALTPELTRRRKIALTTDIWELKLHNPALRVYYYQPGAHVISVLYVGSKAEQEHDVLRLEYFREKAEALRREARAAK